MNENLKKLIKQYNNAKWETDLVWHGLEEHGLEEHGLERHDLEKHDLERRHLERRHLERRHLERRRVEKLELERYGLGEHGLEEHGLEEHGLESLDLERHRLERHRLERRHLEKRHLKEITSQLQFIKKFIDPIVLKVAELHPKHQDSVENLLTQFVTNILSIGENRNPSDRPRIIKNVKDFKRSLVSDYAHLHTAVDILNELNPNRKTPDLKKEKKKYDDATKLINARLKEMESKYSQQNKQVLDDKISTYGDLFKKEAEKNNIQLRMFRILIIGFIAICVALLSYILPSSVNSTDGITNILDLVIKGQFVYKFFLLTLFFFALSMLKKEYMALRHNYILNTHRHNALISHKEILQSIEKTTNNSDKEIANAVLLELTKAMFGSQDTGFVKSGNGSSSGNQIIEISKSISNLGKNS